MTRQREAPELGSACVRLMRALARRAGDGELEALEELASLQDHVQTMLGAGVAGYRAGPAEAPWSAIGEALGTTRQSAYERFRDATTDPAYVRKHARPRALDAWRCAMDQWDRDAEAASNGKSAELAAYAAIHPKPVLRDFMVHLSVGGRP